ncbi:hypothetical protein [Paramaledivibacter caminithermalis]|uniref:Uncharacterized protein n=1 Tax=Paramaledivibacter caminithermalis (strain DSM 15212 / CIP 107654 / DViRD3) TaxID=1121301 RepID=A0A1M6NN70_PARC5|nr:hypothetical protein [Paramaledivibacter caminithermalis]SHJ97108.1 hypothetical protein SAMN02745912_01783 [Paramaledivibacter caminithermalis DSM 15212]
MLLDYVYVAAFVSFPDAVFILLLGFNLSNIRDIKLSRFLVIGGIQSVVALFVRMVNIYFGFHTIMQAISLYLLVMIFLKIKYYKAIIPVLIGILSQGIIQSTILPTIGVIFEFKMTDLYYSSMKLILANIPIFLVSLILLIAIKRKNLFLCDIND